MLIEWTTTVYNSNNTIGTIACRHFIDAVLFLQFINFVSSLIFGFLGYLVSILLIIIYLNSLESFEVPYLYPFTNLNFNKIKETFLSSNFIKRKENKKWKK